MTVIKVIPIRLSAMQKDQDVVTIEGKVMMHFTNNQPIKTGDLVASKVHEFKVDVPLQKLSRGQDWRFGKEKKQ